MNQNSSHKTILEVRKVSRKFGEHKALNDITLDFDKNERVLFLGPNGSGKSTLLKTLSGIYRPTSGTIKVLDSSSGMTGRSEFGYCGHETQLYGPLSVEENLNLFSSLGAKPVDIHSLIRAWKLTQYQSVPVQKLSRGNMAKVGLARTLSSGSRFLLLDEPTTALDNVGKQILLEQLQSLHSQDGCTFIASHDVRGLTEFINRIVIIKAGEVVRQISGRFTEQEILEIYEEACL
jgi:ABC-2 type transport system ATP-binding protein